jgi:hypothetical protein
MAMGSPRALLRLNDQEGMSILALIFRFASVCWPVLAANLCTSDVDGSKMLATSLMERLISDINLSGSPITYAFIVF